MDNKQNCIVKPVAAARRTDQLPTARSCLAITCLTIFVTLSLLSGSARANAILFSAGGNLNGQDVNTAGTTIFINPGEQISGTLQISVQNSHNAGAIVPVGATVTWGDRATKAREVSSHVSTGWTDLSVEFLDTAPLTAGLYHIILGNRGECDYSQVMSATNWALPNSGASCGGAESGPIWNDGNDLGWDWTASQFQQALDDGQVTQLLWLPRTSEFVETTYGANWVGVQVVPLPAAIWLFGSGLLGLVGMARCKKRRQRSPCAC